MNSIVNAAIQHGTLEKRLYDEFEEADHLKIVVLGVGGAGNNTIQRLERIGIEGAELVAVNTDKQDLQKLSGDMTKILIGAKLMRGLGAGGFPELGAKAAEASHHELAQSLEVDVVASGGEESPVHHVVGVQEVIGNDSAVPAVETFAHDSGACKKIGEYLEAAGPREDRLFQKIEKPEF